MSEKLTYEELVQRIQGLEQAEVQHKRAIDTLRENENRYQSLIQKIQAAVVVHGADTKIISSNYKAQELLGLSEDQMLGKTAFDPGWKFIRSDKKEMTVDEYPVNQVLAKKQPLRGFSCGLRHHEKSGLLWMLVSADPVLDENGKIHQIIVTFVDITESKQAQDIIHEQATTLSNILEKAADGICVCHNIPEEPYIRFTHWNPRMTEITGYTINEINKLGWYQTVYPDPEIRQQAIEKMTRMRKGDDLHSEEWVITTKYGEKKHLSISTSTVKNEDGKVHALAVMKDVSERQKAEEALRESHRKYQNIIEKSEDIIWTSDLNIKTTYVSPSIEKKLGFSPKERMAQGLEEQMPPSSYTAIIERFAQELERENDENVDPNRIIRMEVEYYHKNGSILWFENIASGLRDENGTLTGIHGISRDITDKKLVERALQESEEKYKLLAENSADVIYKLNLENEQCTYASPAVEAMFGYTVKESLSLKAQDMLTGESYVEQRDKLIESIEGGYRNPVALELEVIRKDGSTLPVEINANFLFDEHGNPVEILGVARDITERKQAENKLLAEKNKLEDALAEIKKLSGLLPICASCKNIRDDKGYWNQIETYIKEHSEAEFTHSICPQCAKKLYPDLDFHKR